MRIAEQSVIGVVSVPPGRVERPPGCLESDAIGVVEADRADEAVVNHIGDLATRCLESVTERQQRLLVGQVERLVVELRRAMIGYAGRLCERLDRDIGVLEERRRGWSPNEKK